MPENSLPNAEGVQKLISLKSLHSAESAKEQNNSHNTKNAQEQIPEKCSKTNARELIQHLDVQEQTREFITQCRKCSRTNW
ncbi:45101_t:CDS:2 [Gigaspora margarita]|uniref:45101_t:CDS:1 n=1 Tax=Gigaspora margarita TaxID=4874 RepID=A0ABN7WKZ8_GIGMA|nr:45101_t:CDS:2 [Gigaspora margarita]